MKEKVLITAALPYANGPLHFGHIAGAYLPADCYARFERLCQNDVLFLSGSDEYGFAITMSADLARRGPQEHVDIFHRINKAFFDKLNISFDHYSRTTWEGHKAPVQQFFLDLLHNGYIEERVTEQLYSEQEKRFLADRYVTGTCPKCGFEGARGDECQKCGSSFEATDLKNPRSKLSGAPLILKPTKHWFLLLDKLHEKVLAFLESKNWKPNVTQFAKNYCENLRPRAITRDSDWGIPVPLPGAQGKVLYVWFDAPIGYISGAQQWDKERWKEYWLDPKTKLVQFIGKDNIPFHAVIFPAMVLGQNVPYKLVDELPANEFYNLEGKQFSKSEGWYIDLETFFKTYTVDQIRYTIAANAPESADAEFTWRDFQMRCNAELLGKYGNFANRVLVFAKNYCEGRIPSLIEPQQEVDTQFLADIAELVQEAKECYRHFKIRRAAQLVMELAQLGNGYFDTKKPWLDVRSEETRYRANLTIAACLECLKALALISYPIIPTTAKKLWHFIGGKKEMEEMGFDAVANERLKAGTKLAEPEILFHKVEEEQIEKEMKKLQEPLKQPIDYEQFALLDLRIGQILSAKPVPKSKKLLVLEVDLGFETRTIVSGIAQHFKPEELISKKVVVVVNLKPATLMGIESRGMILASSFENTLELLQIQKLPPGSIVN